MENHAAEQLAAISDARSSVADRLITPWWYHPILGAMLAGLILSYGFGNIAYQLAVAVLFILGCGALTRAYRRLTGIWVSGFDAGRAGRWAIALSVLLGVIIATAWATGEYTDLSWPVWALAGAGFVGVNVLGHRFDKALRAQLRAAA